MTVKEIEKIINEDEVRQARDRNYKNYVTGYTCPFTDRIDFNYFINLSMFDIEEEVEE